MVTTGILPPQGKIPMVEPGIEPGTSWLVVRSSDHQTTRLVVGKVKLTVWKKYRVGEEVTDPEGLIWPCNTFKPAPAPDNTLARARDHMNWALLVFNLLFLLSTPGVLLTKCRTKFYVSLQLNVFNSAVLKLGSVNLDEKKLQIYFTNV